MSEIYSPVTGTVVEVNEALDDAPEQVNADPYGAGWIFVVELADPTEVDALLDAAAYRALVERLTGRRASQLSGSRSRSSASLSARSAAPVP